MTYTEESDRIQREDSGAQEVCAAVLALGSNLGDRLAHLRGAVHRLRASGVEVLGASSVYETEAVGGGELAPAFLNAVVEIEVSISPSSLLVLTQSIEKSAGRLDAPRDAPRELDIDILFYGQRIVARPGLTIPHRGWRDRSFVLEPLCEVAPRWRDPETGSTVQEVLAMGGWNRTPVSRVLPPETLLAVSHPEPGSP